MSCQKKKSGSDSSNKASDSSNKKAFSGIRAVVEAGLCAGCGLCASLSEGKIKMGVVPPGRMRPIFEAGNVNEDGNLEIPDIPNEELMLRVCPGIVVDNSGGNCNSHSGESGSSDSSSDTTARDNYVPAKTSTDAAEKSSTNAAEKSSTTGGAETSKGNDHPVNHKTNDSNLIDESKNYDGFMGPIINVFEGYASNPETRFKAAAGGGLTGLCEYLLAKKEVDFIHHVRADRPNNPMLSVPHESRNRDEVLLGSQSRYGPVAPLEGIVQVLER
jgi:coenzyme F420-reducing hydrogenase beta subunit